MNLTLSMYGPFIIGFESIEFNTTNSRIEIVCGKCHGAICWWPISTEQIVPVAAGRIKKLSAVQVELD